MTGYFTPPGCGAGTFKPLHPCNIQEHLDYYVDVDSTGSEFARFEGDLQALDLESGLGMVVVVMGPDGTGKTSFLHRCAHLMRERSSREVSVVDMSGERLSPAWSVDDRIRYLYERIKDEFTLKGTFSESEKELLAARDDPSLGFPILGRLVAKREIHAIVVMPPSQKAEEVSRLTQVASVGLTFLTECAEPEAVDRLRTMPLHEMPQLNRYYLDVLAAEDGWKYVEQWMKLYADGTVVATKEVVDQFMRTRIDGRGRTTIRELEKTCRGVFAIAEDAHQPEVGYDDFAAYFIRRGDLQ